MANKRYTGLQCAHLKHYTGLQIDSSDRRDFIKRYSEEEIPSTSTHPVVDLRQYIFRVFDQGDLHSCTANVVCAAYQLLLQKQAKKHVHYNFKASRLFVYYNSRSCNPDIRTDAGASMRNTLKTMNRLGVCHESFWPYDILKFAHQPSNAARADAVGNSISKYERLTQDLHQLRACLNEGYPFAFGFAVYDTFELEMENDGLMPMPTDEETHSGATEIHGVLAVGYNDNTKCFTILNSWGSSFGDGGYFYMPYKYIVNTEQAFDFWKICDVKERNLDSKPMK